MRYYRVGAGGDLRVIARTADAAYDLTSAKGSLTSFLDLAHTADVTDQSIDDITEGLIAPSTEVDFDETADSIGQPVDAEEVWAAGVTYEISEEAREAESVLPEMYREVYDSTRPEVFFKSTPSRTVGPGEDVGIRADSEWDVPEPELGVVLYRGEAVGYTVGNDMSSRSIEGENPLYLPQAKVYDRCCSIGPCVTSIGSIGDPHDLAMTMTIARDGETVFEGSTTTANLARTCEELSSYFTRHNAVPELSVLLTGTALVPDGDFSLEEGDRISIDIENIGRLENDVRIV